MNEMQEREPIHCNGEHCQSHEYMSRTLGDLEEIQESLVAGQQQLQVAFAQLAETTRAVLKLHERIDKVEKRQWIAIGGLMVISGIASAGWAIKLAKIMLQ